MKRLRKKKKNAQVHQNGDGPFFPKVQKKLSIGKADDAFEKEADHVAEKVVAKSGENGALQTKSADEEQVQEKPVAENISILQKQDMKEEEPTAQQKGEEEKEPVQKEEEEEAAQPKGEEEEAQAKEMEEEPVQKEEEEGTAQSKEEEELQKKSSGTSTASQRVESKIKSKKGKGKTMDPKTRQQMEYGFGAGFQHVNIHTDAESQEMNRSLGAQAFTVGNDIYFNTGKYNPSSKKGKELLAHELTHTIQQKGAKSQKPIQKQEEGGGSCAASDVRQYELRNGIDFEFTVPSGCQSIMTFEAKWFYATEVSCCTGDEHYSVFVNDRQRRLPVGYANCGEESNQQYETGTIRTGAGRQRIRIRVNANDCPGIKMHVRINTRIH